MTAKQNRSDLIGFKRKGSVFVSLLAEKSVSLVKINYTRSLITHDCKVQDQEIIPS